MPITSLFENYKNTKIFVSLDGLRYLSIVAVLWHHSGLDSSWRGFELGFLGVDLFFVISGYLITTLLLRERDKFGTISLARFYARRALRIFPAYFGLLAALSAIYLTVRQGSVNAEEFFSDLPFYLTYTANFVHVGIGVLWSLSVEEQFYLIWPTVEKQLEKSIIWLLLLLIAVNQLFNFKETRLYIAEIFDAPSVLDLLIYQTTFTPLLLGVGAAHMLNNPIYFGYLERFLSWKHSGWIVFGTIFYMLAVAPEDISGIPRLTIQVLLTILVIVCVMSRQSVDYVLSFSIFKRIGKVSYGIYLYHLFIIPIVVTGITYSKIEMPDSIAFILMVGACWAVAELSFRYFESWFLNRKQRFSRI